MFRASSIPRGFAGVIVVFSSEEAVWFEVGQRRLQFRTDLCTLGTFDEGLQLIQGPDTRDP